MGCFVCVFFFKELFCIYFFHHNFPVTQNIEAREEKDLIEVLSKYGCKWERSLEEFEEWCWKYLQYAKHKLFREAEI